MKGSNFFNLASFEATDRQRKTIFMIGIAALTLSLIVIPYAPIQLQKVPAFVSLYVSIILIVSMLTAYLLYKHFRTTRYRPLLILSATYFYIGIISIFHLLVFPEVLLPSGLAGANAETPLWFWVLWHGGFPVGVLLYIWSLKLSKSRQSQEKRLNRANILSVYAGILCLVILCFLVTTKFHYLLPAIITDDLVYTNYMKFVNGPFIFIFHVVALIFLWRMRQMRTILHVSLLLSVFMSLLDVVVTLFGEGRYTVGWYTARLNTVVSSSIILATFVYELNKLSDILAEQYQRSQSLFHHNLDAVFSLEIDGRVGGLNQMSEKLIGYSQKELLGESIFQFVASHDKQRVMQITEKVLTGEPQNFETLVLHRDGHIVEVSVIGIPIFVDGTIIGAFCIAKDITAQKTAQKQLEEANRILQELSLCDGLTGLGNRRYLEDYLQKKWNACLRDRSPLSVILIDIDNFKAYNDEYGHMMGDRCLQEVAHFLQSCVDPNIGLASRYGGEELCVILPAVDAAQAYALAERIRSGVERLDISHRRSEYGRVTISLGFVSKVPVQEGVPCTFLEMADKALYQCKKEGKNCISSFQNDGTIAKRQGRLL